MPVHEVTERSSAGSPVVVCPPVFTGREREVAALAAALGAAPAVVIVEGEAGIGKTRLIREYLATPEGKARRTLVAGCPPLARPQTLGPPADALRQALGDDGASGLGLSALAGALRPLFPEWAADLPPAPERAEDASAARHRVFAALAELLARMRVGLLVVEDVHWADEATLEFVLYLAAREPRPLSLVATCRPEDAPARPLLPRLSRLAAGTVGHRIMLGPLELAGTGRLVSSMLGGEHISGEFAVFVHQHTDGLPLAAEELMRLMAARGDIVRRGGAWGRRQVQVIDVPPVVRDAVLERATRLSPDAQEVLRAAAVLADPASEAMLAAVAGITAGQAQAGLCEALSCGLLDERGRGLVSFRHDLAARAVYEAVPGPGRRTAHQRAAEALEGTPQPPAACLARHFREAADVSKWSWYAEQAADAALAVGDEATAGDLLCDLIHLAGLPTGEVARLAGKIVPWALQVLTDTGNLAPREEAEVRFQLSRVLGIMDDFESARAEMKRAVLGLPADSPQAFYAVRLLGMPSGTSPAGEYLRWLRRAARTVPPDPVERLRLAVSRATSLLMLGRQEGWAAAAVIPGAPSEPRERAQVTIAHGNIGEAALLWGRYRDAAKSLTRAVELAGQYGYPQLRGNALVVRAHLDWFTGAWEGLAGRVEALASDEDLSVITRQQALLVAGLLHGCHGARDDARTRLRHALEEARGHGAVDYLAQPAAALARLAMADGDAGAAVCVTDEAMSVVSRKGTWVWAADLAPARAEALAASGRYDDAQALVIAFARALQGRDAPAPRAGLMLCRAILAEARGEHARAAGLSARAAACWEALPRPYDALLAREREARCLLAAGKDDVGTGLLAGVQTGLSRLGATGDADRVAHSLRGHGVAVPQVWRGGRHGYGDQLSPRELDVVRLAAAGHTNKEIAAVLYRSPHTVGHQLKSAMRKLGVSSRTALAVSPGMTGTPDAGGPDGGLPGPSQAVGGH